MFLCMYNVPVYIQITRYSVQNVLDVQVTKLYLTLGVADLFHMIVFGFGPSLKLFGARGFVMKDADILSDST